jgi:hypothetical protein
MHTSGLAPGVITVGEFQDVLDELDGVKRQSRGKAEALCPAHDDTDQSLSVAEGDKQPVVLYCHAGCDFRDIVAELDSLSTDWKPWEGTEVARNTYLDRQGRKRYDVVRWEMRDEEHPACGEKTFTQQAYLPDHEDAGQRGCPEGYVWGRETHGIDPVLYHLPEVTEAADNGKVVFVVEGEKDVKTLREWGFVATTPPQGAGEWEPQYTDALSGAKVVILPDNDAEGREHAQMVAQEVLPVAESVRILSLPDLPKRGDVTDWAETGGTAGKLKNFVQETPDFTPKADGRSRNGSGESASESGERYVKKHGRIIHVKPTGNGKEKRSVVSDFVAEITQEVTREDETRLYHIEGETRQGQPFDLNIEASEFERSRVLKSEIGAAAGAQAAVRAGMARHVPAALKMISDDVEQRRRYGRTGWSEDGFLLPGLTHDDVDMELPDALPYRVHDDANLQRGKTALDNLIRARDPRKTAPVISFFLTGPVVRHVDHLKRYGFFIKGLTGTLKTSWSQAAMCLYGPRFIQDEMLLKMGEGMTRNAAMKLASVAHDLPILFDNYKQSTGRGDRDFINLIHNVIEGGEKARLDRNSQLREQREIRAWPMVTGEDLPDTDAASLARILTVEFERDGDQHNPELTAAQNDSHHLSAIGREWIQWLYTEEGREAVSSLQEIFPERRKKWAAYLRENRPDMVNILRVASNLATNTLVWDVAEQCPVLRPVLSEYREAYKDGLAEIAYDMGDYTCESLEARRLLTGLRSLKAAERITFDPRLGNVDEFHRGEHVGYSDGKGYYLILDLAIQAVSDLYEGRGELGGVSKQTLCSQLKSIGAVAKTGSSKTTRTVRTGDGDRKRVLHLKKRALEETEPDAED